MKVYVLVCKTFNPETMDAPNKEIVDIYKNNDDAENRRIILEHEEELYGLMYPGDESWSAYYILERELR